MHLSINPIIARLEEGGARGADGIIEFSAQTADPVRLPAFFVVPADETVRGDANDRAGVSDQRVTASFHVFVVIAGARRAEKVREDLKIETDKVIDALAGWKHPEASGACSYAGGKLAGVSASTVTWALRFNSPYHIRKAR